MNPVDMRMKRAAQLLALSRPPHGFSGAPIALTSAPLMGLGEGFRCLLRAGQRSDDTLQPEERLALQAQGIAAVLAEFLAGAPPAVRISMFAAVNQLAADERAHMDADDVVSRMAGEA